MSKNVIVWIKTWHFQFQSWGRVKSLTAKCQLVDLYLLKRRWPGYNCKSRKQKHQLGIAVLSLSWTHTGGLLRWIVGSLLKTWKTISNHRAAPIGEIFTTEHPILEQWLVLLSKTVFPSIEFYCCFAMARLLNSKFSAWVSPRNPSLYQQHCKDTQAFNLKFNHGLSLHLGLPTALLQIN